MASGADADCERLDRPRCAAETLGGALKPKSLVSGRLVLVVLAGKVMLASVIIRRKSRILIAEPPHARKARPRLDTKEKQGSLQAPRNIIYNQQTNFFVNEKSGGATEKKR